MRVTNINKLADYKREFEQYLQNEHNKNATKFETKFTEKATKLLNRTLQNRGQTDENGFKDAKASVRFIIRRKSGVSMTIRVVMNDARTGEPHKIWHIINNGRSAIITKKITRFKSRKNRRTSSSTLDASPFSGYDGWRSVAKGDKIAAVEGTDYYGKIEEELLKEFGDIEGLERM